MVESAAEAGVRRLGYSPLHPSRRGPEEIAQSACKLKGLDQAIPRASLDASDLVASFEEELLSVGLLCLTLLFSRGSGFAHR